MSMSLNNSILLSIEQSGHQKFKVFNYVIKNTVCQGEEDYKWGAY